MSIWTADKSREYCKEYWRIQRWIILTHYSDNPPKCVCCGESRYEFLSLDHIHGGGITHRLQVNGLT